MKISHDSRTFMTCVCNYCIKSFGNEISADRFHHNERYIILGVKKIVKGQLWFIEYIRTDICWNDDEYKFTVETSGIGNVVPGSIKMILLGDK